MAKGLILLGALAALVAVAAPSSARMLAGCTRTAGSSSDLQQVVRSVPVAATVCVRGVHRGRLVIDRPLTLRGSRGAAIAGGITVDRRATGAVIAGLTVRGSGRARAAIVVSADGVHVTGDRISGPGYRNLNTACVLLDGTRDAVVDGNRISACTSATRSNLSAPGVFVGSAYGARVSNNLITRTVGFGIVLGPNAQHSFVLHNIVDGSSGGIEIVGNRRTASSYNVVRNNVFSNSRGANVRAQWSGAVGKKNAVVSNCLWHSIGAETAAPGVALAGNLVADPRYKHPPASYAMTGGPCVAKHPSIVPPRLRTLPAFRVQYRLRATAARVRIVSLALSGVAAGAKVAAACSCSIRWSGRASGPAVTLRSFAGRSLPVGTTVDVRATKPGFVGAFARITVTGLPKGVTISHACLAPGASAPTSCGSFR